MPSICLSVDPSARCPFVFYSVLFVSELPLHLPFVCFLRLLTALPQQLSIPSQQRRRCALIIYSLIRTCDAIDQRIVRARQLSGSDAWGSRPTGHAQAVPRSPSTLVSSPTHHNGCGARCLLLLPVMIK
jgi:hypothetical protein